MKYSTEIMKNLKQPQNVGVISGATHHSLVVNPICGDSLSLHLCVVDSMITDASFEAEGCPPTMAVGSILTEKCKGRDLQWCQSLTVDEIVSDWLGGVPPGKEHVGHLALTALREALSEHS